MGPSERESLTSVSEVWETGGGRSSSTGVEQRGGKGELGRWTDGMPARSGSSIGKREAKST